MSINRVIITGNLAADPIFYPDATDSNKDKALFTLGTNTSRDNNNPGWLGVVAWGKTARAVVEYCHKGKEVTIDGQLNLRSAQDVEGNWFVERVEVSCSFVSFGRDARKNSAKPATARQRKATGEITLSQDQINALIQETAAKTLKALNLEKEENDPLESEIPY